MNSQPHPQQKKTRCISIVIPVFNEEKNIPLFHAELSNVLHVPAPSSDYVYTYECIYVNDGSSDGTSLELEALQAASLKNSSSLHSENIAVHSIEFSRNFGKEVATTAGIHHAQGDAVIIIDADLQHPVTLIPEFIHAWQKGADVVIGIRNKSKSDSRIKKVGSYFFYKIMRNISDTEIIPSETDFRLLDRKVVEAFNTLTEKTRMTRSLINWLGFEREYIYFDAHERENGTSSFSVIKLTRLAISSFVSHSLLPLRLAGYLGGFITLAAGILGIVMFTDRYLIHMHLDFSGPAILADIILFLVGILLMAIGILAVYVGTIHQEVQNRPLYIIKNKTK